MIREWLLGKLLQGKIILFELNETEFIPINDITLNEEFMFCRFDPRDIEERMADVDE